MRRISGKKKDSAKPIYCRWISCTKKSNRFFPKLINLTKD
jgi:hypothetical protein